MDRFPGPRRRRRLALLLGLLLLGTGCQFTAVGEGGRERCRRLSASAGNPLSAALQYLRCLPTTERQLAREQAERQEAADARQAAVDACRRRQRTLTSLMASLRRAEEDLAAARHSAFRPSLAPPPPLDPNRESRYRLEDQQLDRERHEAALGAWEEQVAAERSRWRQQRAERIEAAQNRLNREQQALRRLEPDLFTGPESIEFRPEVVAKITASCTGRS